MKNATYKRKMINLERKIGHNLSTFLLEVERLTENLAECEIDRANNEVCQYTAGVLARMLELEHLLTKNDLRDMAERIMQYMLDNGALLRHIRYVEGVVEYMIACNERAS